VSVARLVGAVTGDHAGRPVDGPGRVGQDGPMPTEREKMLAGEEYVAADPELAAASERCRRLTHEYNAELDLDRRDVLLRELIGSVGERVTIRSPFACDYGEHISIGSGTFVNVGGIILDCARVTIGEDVQIGTAVQLLTPDHPRDPVRRRSGVESANPITIGDNVWLGGGVIVLGGVTIGANSIIGAGSVVTRDVPADVVAVGNPCRVLRSLA
jgi:maltose O-acetyltransferase